MIIKILPSEKSIFVGVKLNNANQVTNSYVCGIKNDKPFCIEGTIDGSKYAINVSLLQGKDFSNNSCISANSETHCQITNDIFAIVYSDGTVFIGDGDSGFYASDVGTIYSGYPN